MKKLPFEKPKKRPKLKPISTLKKKAWRLFSEWIRRRHADGEGFVHCITCQTYYHWKSVHAGHYLHGHNALSFLDESNVHAQCLKCNHFLSGNLLEYHKYMLKTYGAETIVKLENLKCQIWKPSRDELQGLIERYTELIKGLENNNKKGGELR